MKKIYLLSIIFIVLLSCNKSKTKQEEIIRPIKYIKIGNSSSNLTRTFSGNVKASNEIELSFRTSGTITSLNAKVGLKVKKGALIAKLDNVQAQLAYEQALSSLNSAKSALSTAKSQLNRVKILYEKGSNSLSEYESAKNIYQSNLDQHDSAKKNVSIKKSQISNGFIYAPKTGTITTKNLSLNETASSGQIIAILAAGDDLNIETNLPEVVINKIHLNMEAKIEFSAFKGENFLGEIIEISPIADASSSTYPIKVAIKNINKKIKQGMTAKVIFNFKTQNQKIKTSKIIVPVNTVGEDRKGNFVFIVNSKDGKIGIVKKQTISLGKLTDEGFEVVKGLKQGDLLVTAGINSLLNGQKVKL